MDISWDLFLNAIAAGLLLGAFYAAVIAGISISFGMLDIVNIAHPAFVILGSYIAYFFNINFGVDPILISIIALPVFYLLWSLWFGKDAPANPWGAVGLEWTTSSPPPTENFEEQPVVTWEAYEFSRKEPDVVRASSNDTSPPV